MKKLLGIVVLGLLLSGNAYAKDNRYFGNFTYWDNLKKVQKDFYAKGALDSWGYYIWNQAPDKQRDELISQFRYCADKDFQSFQQYMFLMGWDEGDNAADEVYKWSTAACENLSKTDGYKNLKVEKNKPIENINLTIWKQLDKTNKKVYLAGYTDGAISIVRSTIANKDAPQEARDHYTKLLNSIYKCFDTKGIDAYADFAIAEKIDKSFPIPWNMTFSLGKFCKEFR